jgi:hypothetical protein
MRSHSDCISHSVMQCHSLCGICTMNQHEKNKLEYVFLEQFQHRGVLSRNRAGPYLHLYVTDCSAETLLAILKTRILPGTTIISNCWGGGGLRSSQRRRTTWRFTSARTTERHITSSASLRTWHYVPCTPRGPLHHVYSHHQKFWLVTAPHAPNCWPTSPLCASVVS